VVPQLVTASEAPAPKGAVGGDGKVMDGTCRHSDDALASQGLDLLRQELVHVSTVAQHADLVSTFWELVEPPMAQLAIASIAPAPEGAVGGGGEAVGGSSRHSDDALASRTVDASIHNPLLVNNVMDDISAYVAGVCERTAATIVGSTLVDPDASSMDGGWTCTLKSCTTCVLPSEFVATISADSRNTCASWCRTK